MILEIRMRFSMKKAIKGYLVFTSCIYRIVMFGVLPFALIALYILLTVFMEGNAFLLFCAVPFLIIMAEIVADTWLFGGIQRKDAAKMDFLKTSSKGMGLLRNALTMDLVRRFLSFSGVMVICLLVNINIGKGMEMFGGSVIKGLGVILALILSAYAVSVLCTLLSRFGTMLWQSLMAGYLGLFMESVCVGFMVSLGHPLIWCCVFGVLALGISVLAVNAVMKNVRGGYYDE